MRRNSSRRRGVSVLELLAVIVVVLLLVMLLVPMVRQAFERSRRAKCANNLRQVGIAIQNYDAQFGQLPAAYHLHVRRTSETIVAHNWTACVLPYLEYSMLSTNYDWRLDPVSNAPATSALLSSLTCPATPAPTLGPFGGGPLYTANIPEGSVFGRPVSTIKYSVAPSDYCVTSGVRGELATLAYDGAPGDRRHGALLPWITVDGQTRSRPVALGLLPDGTSYTTLVGERTGGSQIYSRGALWEAAPGKELALLGATNGGGWGDPLNGEHWLAGAPRSGLPWPPIGGEASINITNLRGHGFYSFHERMCNFLMGDGAVRPIHEDISPFPMAAAITASKGELTDFP